MLTLNTLVACSTHEDTSNIATHHIMYGEVRPRRGAHSSDIVGELIWGCTAGKQRMRGVQADVGTVAECFWQ